MRFVLIVLASYAGSLAIVWGALDWFANRGPIGILAVVVGGLQMALIPLFAFGWRGKPTVAIQIAVVVGLFPACVHYSSMSLYIALSAAVCVAVIVFYGYRRARVLALVEPNT